MTLAACDWQGQDVLVTGGAGFIGGWLCERLLREGAVVHCVDSFITGRRENIAPLLDDPHFHLYETDLAEGIPVERSVSLAFHLASPASSAQYLAHPLETLRAGSLGTQQVLDYAQACGARLVLASSSEVYGAAKVHPQSEDYWGNVNPIGPRSVYDESKRFSEALTMTYARQCGADVVVARLFNTYGPRMDPDDGRVVPTFLRQAMAGEPLTVAGDGSQTRSLCWVGDTVEGLMGLAALGSAGPYNLGNPQEVTMIDLAREVLRLTESRSPIISVERPVDDPQVRCPDITRISEEIGWAPRTTLAQGLKAVIDDLSGSSILVLDDDVPVSVS